MSGERQIELTWVCSSCQERNLGRHMACARCGNPKDASEVYEMPADPAKVPSVTDAGLVKMATAGARWKCAFCGCEQRAYHGGCSQCGAGRPASASRMPVYVDRPSLAMRAQRVATKRVPRMYIAVIAAVGAFGLVVIVGVAFAARRRDPVPLLEPTPFAAPPSATDFDAEVESVRWRRLVTVDTWQLVTHEGFEGELPEGALEVKSTGRKVHHHEDVFDHDETTYEDVDVPDGTRAETYTEHVPCGQDCRTTPRVCRPVCTTTPRTCKQTCKNNKNGFATCTNDCSGGTTSCRDDCSGGSTTCQPKFCDEQRTRQVPKTKKERRAKVVKKTRSEPRYAIGATYKLWEWKPLATFDAHGDDVFMHWPETAPDAGTGALFDADGGGAPKAGDRREARSERVRVVFRREEGTTHEYEPTSEAEFAKLRPGTKHAIHIEGGRVSLR